MSSSPAPPDRPQRWLGVDPGSLVSGWGLIGGTAARASLISCGALKLGRSIDPLEQRLARLKNDLERLIVEHAPTSAAVEAPYHGASARSALLLAHARGVVLAVLADAGIRVAEYSPATVKKAVTGNGRAPKEQVRAMVCRLLADAPDKGPDDLFDALAVALCHAASSRIGAAADGRHVRRAPGRLRRVPR